MSRISMVATALATLVACTQAPRTDPYQSLAGGYGATAENPANHPGGDGPTSAPSGAPAQ